MATNDKETVAAVDARSVQALTSLPKLSFHVSKNPNVTTFMHDDSLPSLPLPSLENTLQRYLDGCCPILTAEELANTKQIVDQFMQGDGPLLQEKLQQRADTKKNWLADWWLHYAYLTFRPSLIPFLNTGGPQTLHLTSWPPSRENAIMYASLFLYTSLYFHDVLREERLRPQASLKGEKFSMDQFQRLFNTCRIPGEEHDSVYTCWKKKGDGFCPQHVVVLCHGHIWKMDPYDSTGKILSLPELEAQLQHARTQSDDLGVGPGVAALTTDERTSWAKNRAWLRAVSPSNSSVLQAIESALLVVVLDDTEPQDMSQASWMSLCGDGSNRWADKSLSLVVSRNGYVASNADHTPFDAMALVVLIMFQRSLLQSMDVPSMRAVAVRPHLRLPHRLLFTLDPALNTAIEQAKRLSRKNNENVLVSFEHYTVFGKDWMKESGVHPDAFVQTALQLTYYRQYNKMAPTYETATTRQFYRGRTETLRSCTSDARCFVEVMDDPTATPVERAAALRTSCATHDRLMRECQRGQGVDRHLMGLYLTAVEGGSDVPALFTDPAFVKTGGGGNYVLSTSTIGYTDTTGGAAPMVPHGYGCFYSMLPDRIYLFITSFRDGGTLPAPQFSRAIMDSLSDMRDLLDATRTTPSKL